MTTVLQHTPPGLADIVASCPPWHRARLSTILVWPTIHGGWTAILSYAHYTTVQPGETPSPDNNVTYPHDTHHRVALDGTDAAAVQAHPLLNTDSSNDGCSEKPSEMQAQHRSPKLEIASLAPVFLH